MLLNSKCSTSSTSSSSGSGSLHNLMNYEPMVDIPSTIVWTQSLESITLRINIVSGPLNVFENLQILINYTESCASTII